MDTKPGYKTTEFWATALTGLLPLIGALLVFYGMLSEEEVQLWIALFGAVLASFGSLGTGYAASQYSKARAEVKKAAVEYEHEMMKLESAQRAEGIID